MGALPVVPCLALALERPLALLLLALALPLLLAHLARRRRQRVVVPQVALLVEARGAVAGGGLGARLREPLALLARVGALCALVLVAAGLPEAPAASRALVLVLDADATREAREADGRARWLHGLEAASAEVRAHAAGPLGVVVAQDVPWVLAQDVPAATGPREALAARLGPTGDLARLRGRGPAPLGPALALARRLAGAGGRVLALTARDLPPQAGELGVEVRGVGTADDDVGFVALRLLPAGPGEAGGERVRLVLGVQALGARAAQRRLVVQVGEGWREERSLALEADEQREVVLEVPVPPEGGVLRARLEPEGGGTADRLARNDALEVVLPAPARPAVLAVHDGAGLKPWTAAALGAMGERLDRARSGAVAASALASAGPRDVVVGDGAALPAGSLVPGAYVFLAPSGGELPFGLAAPVERPVVWRALPGHPLALDLDLADAWVARATPLQPGPGLVAVATAGADQPVLAEGERDGVRYEALALDPAASDLPVRAAFPLLLRNAILRLARARTEALPPFVQAGEPLRARLPLPGGERVRVAWAGAAAPQEARVGLEQGPTAPYDALGLARLEPGAPTAAAAGGPGTGGAGAAAAPGTAAAAATAAAGAAAGSLQVAVVDLTPWRIAPARLPGPLPAPQPAPGAPAPGWAQALLGLAALLLALDLALGRARGGGTAGPPGVALSPLRASLALWKTESSAKP
ncbi:MAG: hypothetical protein ACKOSS_01080 [Planctomycetia bacterium]